VLDRVIDNVERRNQSARGLIGRYDDESKIHRQEPSISEPGGNACQELAQQRHGACRDGLRGRAERRERPCSKGAAEERGGGGQGGQHSEHGIKGEGGGDHQRVIAEYLAH
jgi:hypothetical protein